MKWPSLQTVVLALALFTTTTQCLMTCAGEPDDSKVPPCHRQHSSKPPCKASLFVAELPGPVVAKAELALHANLVALPVYGVCLTTPDFTRDPIYHETSPPTSLGLAFSTVLRV